MYDLAELPLLLGRDQPAEIERSGALRGPLSLLPHTVFHWPWFARYTYTRRLEPRLAVGELQALVLRAGRRTTRRRRRASRE